MNLKLICTARLTLNTTFNDDTSPDAVLRKKLHWHSRRGMWELDLLLLPFLDQCYDMLHSEDQQMYQRLIQEEDQDLFVWLMRREWPEDPAFRRIVKMIVNHAESLDNAVYRTL